MPLYRYKAVNGAGATVQGEFDAPGESLVVEWLRESALMPLKIEIAKGGSVGHLRGRRATRAPGLWFQRRKITQEQLLDMTRELATLLKAGLPLDRAIEILINLSDSRCAAGALAADPRRRARRLVAVAGARQVGPASSRGSTSTSSAPAKPVARSPW